MTKAQTESEVGIETDSATESRRQFGISVPKQLVIGTMIAFVLAWEITARFGFEQLDLVFPSVVSIVTELYLLFATGDILPHLSITAQAVGTAFVIATVVGVIGGTLIGTNKFLADAIEPILYYFSSVPKIVLYPLFLVALGIGLESKIAMGILSALFPITVNSIIGSLSIREDLVKVANIHQASRWETFRSVYLPSMITHIINGLRLGIGVAIISVVLAEDFASQAGLGNQVQFYFSNLYMERMYAVLIILFGGALTVNLSLLWVQNWLAAKGYGESDSDIGMGL